MRQSQLLYSRLLHFRSLTKKSIGNTEQDNVDGDNPVLDTGMREEMADTTKHHEHGYGQVGNATVIGISIRRPGRMR